MRGLRALGVLFIMAALVLFFWQNIRAYFTDRVNHQVITSFEQQDKAPEVNPLERWITQTDPEKVTLKKNMLGYLEIPAAGINEPLLKGPATQANLENGVTLVEKDEQLSEQNIAIAGHRVEGAGIRFNYLGRANKGDKVILVTKGGKKVYEIYDSYKVNPSQVSVLNEHPGRPQELTLITCDSYNPDTLLFEERLIVKARIVRGA
ncbi:class A sortase [Macrococcus equipercicus]|uniref:Class A sortase n=1 Tax=Macrococcus equipercicus TaxID=69967 RepID=A0A9Q9BXV3_9STAP|nr:class A sortase [Macrococcus equipercicus]KAA1042766.1 class A sortase [Macrococcus equipercicus]UTH14632.1 class A sortase [Macrococcus equipercicus]